MSERKDTPIEAALLERLERVIVQLRTLTDLQARELTARGEDTLARIHAEEIGIALDELAGLAADLGSHFAGRLPL